MDPATLATLLIQHPADWDALLERHADLHPAALADALRVQYVELVSTNPQQAAAAAAGLADLAQRVTDPTVHALHDWTQGMATLQLEGRPEAAIVLIDAAAVQFSALGQAHTAATTQTSKVYALALLGRYDEALAAGEQARDLLLVHHDTLTAGKLEQNLGNLHHRRGSYQAATTWYAAAREHFAAANDLRLLAFAENGLANVLALQQQSHRAKALYEQALDHAATAGAAVTQAEIECNLGCLSLFQGRYAEALSYLDQSRRHYAALAGSSFFIDNPRASFGAISWFAPGDLNTPVGTGATLNGVTVTPGTSGNGSNKQNELAVSVAGNATTGREYYIRLPISYTQGGASTHYLWYYLQVRPNVNNSSNMSRFVYALGYANFVITGIDNGAVRARAISGLLRPEQVVAGLAPRLLIWQ